MENLIFVIGEPFKERFEGIMLNDAATESNFIRSNGVFTAVSFSSFSKSFYRYLGNQLVVVSLLV